MTVSAGLVVRTQHNGAGSTGPFTTPPFLDDDDLTVILTDTSGDDTTLTITTHYSVSSGGYSSGPTPGNLTLVTALAVGEVLTIVNDPDKSQPADYTANDAFPAATHEEALDRQTILINRLADRVDRSLTLPESAADPATPYFFPDLSGVTAGATLKVNSAQTGLEEGPSAADISTSATAAAASASAAASSASAASSSASSASSSASAASTSASSASTSASSASTSATAAAASATAAQTIIEAVGFTFTFNSATTDSDKDAGDFWFNNASPGSATVAYFDNADNDGNDVTGWLDYLDDITNAGSRGTLTIKGVDDSADLWIGSVTGSVTDGTGYRKVTVTAVYGSGAFADGEEYIVRFAPAGADGSGSIGGSTGATDNVLLRADGTGGETLQNTGIAVDDSDNMSGVAALGATTIELGHATDTTLARSGAGDVTIEGNAIYRAGGTDVPVADGGTGRSSHTAYAVLCGGTTTTGAQQSIASVGTSGQVLTSNGAGALPTFQAAGGGLSYGTVTALSSGSTADISISAGVNAFRLLCIWNPASSHSSYKFLLGDSGGIETSGYELLDLLTPAISGTTSSWLVDTAGFNAQPVVTHMFAEHMGSNLWHCKIIVGNIDNAASDIWMGNKTLSAELTTVRLDISGNTFSSGTSYRLTEY